MDNVAERTCWSSSRRQAADDCGDKAAATTTTTTIAVITICFRRAADTTVAAVAAATTGKPGPAHRAQTPQAGRRVSCTSVVGGVKGQQERKRKREPCKGPAHDKSRAPLTTCPCKTQSTRKDELAPSR